MQIYFYKEVQLYPLPSFPSPSPTTPYYQPNSLLQCKATNTPPVLEKDGQIPPLLASKLQASADGKI